MALQVCTAAVLDVWCKTSVAHCIAFSHSQVYGGGTFRQLCIHLHQTAFFCIILSFFCVNQSVSCCLLMTHKADILNG